ncbi:hypothetical protein F5Y16DRAFT_306637 [Xylariaceae sp. FL0255]|nr:hypothetical protein F5Y16DRAFT_306637 [Xylariaceae sp. FL0255]
MAPPSIPPPPPPPPPLNIPPSRARLQLAARLAMHQKGTATASAQSATLEQDGEDGEASRDQETGAGMRNPFDDDGEDDDSDEDMGGEGEERYTSSSRGSWWRDALQRSREKFGDGRDDSDSEGEEQGEADDDDDEFGDFALPEVGKDGSQEKTGVIVKPLPVHPPPHNAKSSPFTSLWPFGSKEKSKGDEAGAEVGAAAGTHDERDEKVRSTHEAASRTSIEDADEDEVVL